MSSANQRVPKFCGPEPEASMAGSRVVDEELTRSRAYLIYLARKTAGLGGTADSDWTRAEAELRANQEDYAPSVGQPEESGV